MTPSLRLYRSLARLPRPRSYVGKFLLVAFLGVHVPLIAVVSFVAARADWSTALPVVLVALGATLAGTLATMYVQGRLLAPILETSRALRGFVEHGAVPSLPVGFPDEAGRLMGHAQECIVHLAELLRLKNDLLATLSHDARSPLTSIQFASEMGRMALSDPAPDHAEVEEMFGIIDLAARRQLELMNGILTLARADSGRLSVDRGAVRLDALIGRVVELARIQAGQKGVTLRVAAVDAPALELDGSKTEQILGNLVNNAIKFTPSGGTVEVAVEATEEEVGFRVSDTGVGIPSPLLPALFAPFSAAQRTGTAQESGTGLGLWICRTFSELQGGRLEVESEEGRGTLVRVLFPRHLAHDADDARVDVVQRQEVAAD